ncbi:MAG: arylsulfatase [Sinobacteraceae bacterium]|nr:arylsulfatase [Nevskiaceae bacterium]
MPSATRAPNIVLIVADDWGYTDVGAFGGEIVTPTLDALAATGTRFANFHVSAECSPTRAMLLTGLNSHLTGVGAMRETVPSSHLGKPGYLTVLKPEVVTVSSRLQRAGYRTYAVGKWHVGKAPHNLPPARGFDRSLVQADSGSDNWETSQRYLALTDKVYWFEDGREARMPAEFYSSQFYVDKAIDYLRQDRRKEQPFFLYLAFQANHIPLQAPREFIERYRGRYDAGWTALREARHRRAIELGLIPAEAALAAWPNLEDWATLDEDRRAYDARRMEVYAGMATAMDHHLGRLIAHLKQTGEYSDTVFVFLSDNGAEASDPYEFALGRLWLMTEYTNDRERLGAKGAYTSIGPNWASAAAAPLATHKFYAGEGGLRVPLIISNVRGESAGAVNRNFVHVTDITPTLLDLAGVAAAEPLTGHSLLPVLQGRTERHRPPNEALGYELAGNAALFKGDLKLVRNMPPLGDGRWHLHDIARDPGETVDLRSSRPTEFAAMMQDYARFERDNGVLPMPADYDPRQQVMRNALRNVILPAALPPLLVALLLLGGWFGFRRWRQRMRRA